MATAHRYGLTARWAANAVLTRVGVRWLRSVLAYASTSGDIRGAYRAAPSSGLRRGRECHDRDGWWCRGWDVWRAGIWPGPGAGREGGGAMLIALLLALGVDLIVVVAFAAFVLGAGGGSNGSPANSAERSGCPAARSTA